MPVGRTIYFALQHLHFFVGHRHRRYVVRGNREAFENAIIIDSMELTCEKKYCDLFFISSHYCFHGSAQRVRQYHFVRSFLNTNILLNRITRITNMMRQQRFSSEPTRRESCRWVQYTYTYKTYKYPVVRQPQWNSLRIFSFAFFQWYHFNEKWCYNSSKMVYNVHIFDWHFIRNLQSIRMVFIFHCDASFIIQLCVVPGEYQCAKVKVTQNCSSSVRMN